jgi:hypothetical protein
MVIDRGGLGEEDAEIIGDAERRIGGENGPVGR